jgi:hypothetical protein
MNDQGELLLSGLFSEEIVMGHLSLSNFESFRNYITNLDTETVTFINNNVSEPAFSVYPNPVADHIKVNGDFCNASVEFSIFSFNGSLIENGMISSGDQVFTGKLSPGKYILQIIDPATGSRQSCLFIKY